MTTKPTPSRFRIRRSSASAAAAASAAPPAGAASAAADARMPGPAAARTAGFDRAEPAPQDSPSGSGLSAGDADGTDLVRPHPLPLPDPARDEADALAEIRAEGLTGRQLRMARRVAQRHGISASSDLDAVRQLRARGIDPFGRSAVLDLVSSDTGLSGGGGQAGGSAAAESGGASVTQLPQTWRPPAPPSTQFAPPASAAKELRAIQKDIARRRRRRAVLLAARLVVFVLLPTIAVGWYYNFIATPLYATHSEFVIQQAEAPSAGMGGIASMFAGTALATSQDSITVQSYLQSREALQRLNADHGFKDHFSDERIDPIRRLAADATDEAAYRTFRRNVRIGYDPSEGIIRLEVIAADPETSAEFSRALIRYAEEQVDQLTQRLREDQMRGANENYERAEAAMLAAQQRVVELQERFSVLSSEVEVTLLTNQISTLELELTRDRLQLAELLSNARPNPARVEPLQRRIANLEEQIAALRAGLTETGADGGVSLARIQSELLIAEANVQTRQLMLSQALQQLEAARIEANRQVRYLSLGVRPIPPDEATYPRALENTALAFLIFAGLYLMVSMTAAILREQVSA